MDTDALRKAADELWDEATYAADLDEGRMWAAKAWKTRGDPLTQEEAINRLVGRVLGQSATEREMLARAFRAVAHANDSDDGVLGEVRNALDDEHAALVERLVLPPDHSSSSK